VSVLHSPPQETLRIPLGGGTYKRTGKYIPLLERKRQDSYESANERWRIGKGARKAERMKEVDIENNE